MNSKAKKEEKCRHCLNYFRPEGECLLPIRCLDGRMRRLIMLIPGTDCQLFRERR